MNRNTGFTLVEILIVVIILGILAAIVIPQFTEASNDARQSALASDLQTVRSQIELYKVQHLEMLPSDQDVRGDGLATALFITRLTSRTDQAGAIDPDGTYGPYLQTFPTNQFNTFATVGFGAVDATGGNLTGWWLNTSTGKFQAEDSAAHAKL